VLQPADQVFYLASAQFRTRIDQRRLVVECLLRSGQPVNGRRNIALMQFHRFLEYGGNTQSRRSDSSGVSFPADLRRANVRSGIPMIEASKEPDTPLFDSRASNALNGKPRSSC